jgi:hypothetical protein
MSDRDFARARCEIDKAAAAIMRAMLLWSICSLRCSTNTISQNCWTGWRSQGPLLFSSVMRYMITVMRGSKIARTIGLLVSAHQVRKFRDIRRDPPRLIFGKQLGRNVRFTPKSGHWNSVVE